MNTARVGWWWGSARHPQANPTPDGPLGLAGKSTLPLRTKADTESTRHNEGLSFPSTPPPPQQPGPCPSSATPGPTGSHAPPQLWCPPLCKHIQHPQPCPEGFSIPLPPRSRQLSEHFASRLRNKDITVKSDSSHPGQPGRRRIPAIRQPPGCSRSPAVSTEDTVIALKIPRSLRCI